MRLCVIWPGACTVRGQLPGCSVACRGVAAAPPGCCCDCLIRLTRVTRDLLLLLFKRLPGVSSGRCQQLPMSLLCCGLVCGCTPFPPFALHGWRQCKAIIPKSSTAVAKRLGGGICKHKACQPTGASARSHNRGGRRGGQVGWDLLTQQKHKPCAQPLKQLACSPPKHMWSWLQHPPL